MILGLSLNVPAIENGALTSSHNIQLTDFIMTLCSTRVQKRLQNASSNSGQPPNMVLQLPLHFIYHLKDILLLWKVLASLADKDQIIARSWHQISFSPLTLAKTKSKKNTLLQIILVDYIMPFCICIIFSTLKWANALSILPILSSPSISVQLYILHLIVVSSNRNMIQI